MYKYYTHNEEQIFIKNCMEDCLKDIYGYMTDNINKNYYGYLKIYMGNEKYLMLSSYYETIINKENIESYIKSLNWQEIITMKKKNIAAIKEYVIEGYTEHIKKLEEIYTLNILINTDVEEIKRNIKNILKIYTGNIINSDEFITKFLNNIDWNLYLRTMEFKNKTYIKLVEIFYKKAQEREDQQIQEAYDLINKISNYIILVLCTFNCSENTLFRFILQNKSFVFFMKKVTEDDIMEFLKKK